MQRGGLPIGGQLCAQPLDLEGRGAVVTSTCHVSVSCAVPAGIGLAALHVYTRPPLPLRTPCGPPAPFPPAGYAGAVTACEAGGTMKPSVNFPEGKPSRSLQVRGTWCWPLYGAGR